MLLCGVLVDWRVDATRCTGAGEPGLPREGLDQISLVLRQKEDLGLLNDVAQIGAQVLTFARKRARWVRQWLPRERAVHRHIDLLVLQIC